MAFKSNTGMIIVRVKDAATSLHCSVKLVTHYHTQSAVVQGSYMLRRLVKYSCIHAARMSPAHNGSSALHMQTKCAMN